MMTRIKKSTRTILLLTIALLSFGTYLYHLPGAIAATGPQIQLSRIDFQEPIDSLSARRVKGVILAVSGVKQTYFNVPDRIVVFSHDPKIVSADAVLRQIQHKFAFQAERFLPDLPKNSSSCPVTGQNSIFVRMGAYLRRTL